MVINAYKITDLLGNVLYSNGQSQIIVPEWHSFATPMDGNNPAKYRTSQAMLSAVGLPDNLTLLMGKDVWDHGSWQWCEDGRAVNPWDSSWGSYFDHPWAELPTATGTDIPPDGRATGIYFYFSETKYVHLDFNGIRSGSPMKYFIFYDTTIPNNYLFTFSGEYETGSYNNGGTFPWYDVSRHKVYQYQFNIYQEYLTLGGKNGDCSWFRGVDNPKEMTLEINPGLPNFTISDVDAYFSNIGGTSEYDNDSTEESYGQNGSYNDGSDTIENDALPSGSLNSGLINNFYLGNDDVQIGAQTVQQKLDTLGEWLSSFHFDSSFATRMNALVSLKLFFSAGNPDYDPLDVSQGHLRIGDSDVGSGTDRVDVARAEQFTQKKIVENYRVQRYFGNFLDYAPHTKIQIYLPFCGMQELDPSLVIDKDLTIWLKTDWITGDIVYTIHSNGTLIYHFTGNACFDIPMTGADYGAKVTSLVSTAISAATLVGASVINPAAGGAMLGAAAVGAAGLATASQNVSAMTKGTLTNTFSMMDKLQPYLIITRPVQVKATSYASEKGYPSQITANLGSVHGFCTIAEWKLHNMPAVPKEVIDRLDTLVRTEGIIL